MVSGIKTFKIFRNGKSSGPTLPILIICTGLLALLGYFLPPGTKFIVSVGLILSIGLLHGANDFQLIKSLMTSEIRNNVHPIAYFAYPICLLFLVLLFIFYSRVMFLLFMLFSSYHFGQQHFHDKLTGTRIVVLMYMTFYGLTLLFFLFCVWPNNSVQNIALLFGNEIGTDILYYSFFLTLLFWVLTWPFVRFKEPWTK